MRAKSIFRRFGVVLGVFCMYSGAMAIDGGTPPASTDTRFDAVAGFSLTSWLEVTDPSDSRYGNTSCGATLIDQHHAILARHCLPVQFDSSNPPEPYAYSLRFRRKTDGTVGGFQDPPSAFHDVEIDYFLFSEQNLPHHENPGETLANPDLVIAHLATPVTHINPLDFASEAEVVANLGEPAWLVSWARRAMRACDSAVPSGVSSITVGWNEPGSCGVENNDSGGGLIIEVYDDVAEIYVPKLAGVIVQFGSAVRPQIHQALETECVYAWASYADFVLPEYSCDSILSVDLNNNYMVDEGDIALLTAMQGPCSGGDPCSAFDLDQDGVLTKAEINLIVSLMIPALGNRCECIEDINDDGMIDSADLAELTAAWGLCPCDDICPADFNKDYAVDSADLAMLLAAWGPCDH